MSRYQWSPLSASNYAALIQFLMKKRNAFKWVVLCEVIMQCVPFRGTLEAHLRTACITDIVIVCLQYFVQKKTVFYSCNISNNVNLHIRRINQRTDKQNMYIIQLLPFLETKQELKYVALYLFRQWPS